MTVEELASLVADYRNAEREAWRTRSETALANVERLQKRLDEVLAAILRPKQVGLF